MPLKLEAGVSFGDFRKDEDVTVMVKVRHAEGFAESHYYLIGQPIPSKASLLCKIA
jgi:hypothetical protein